MLKSVTDARVRRFDRPVEKSKGPTRRHSLTMVDVEDLTGIVKRIFGIRLRADQAADWKSSLRELISDPGTPTLGEGLVKQVNCVSRLEGAALFLVFLQSEFSEENLQFWQSCEEYKKLRGPALEHKARQIYSNFLKAGAPHEVIVVQEQTIAWCTDVVACIRLTLIQKPEIL